MRELFEETDLRGMHLANRLVRSATWEGLAAPDGACTGRLITLVERLAEGGVGLIISGHAYVSREGQAGPWQMGIHDDALLPGLQEMTGAVHRRGGRIAAQLAHAGVHAASRLSGLLALGPSRPSPVPAGGADGCREMTAADIDQVVQAFGEAAARARHVGFDINQPWNKLPAKARDALLHGTGSEDYLNQAYGMQANAWMRNGSSIHESHTNGYQTSYVFHLENPVRFQKEIKVTIEGGHGNHLANEMSSTAYWYADRPTAAPQIPPVGRRLAVPRNDRGWLRDAVERNVTRDVPLTPQMRDMKERWKPRGA